MFPGKFREIFDRSTAKARQPVDLEYVVSRTEWRDQSRIFCLRLAVSFAGEILQFLSVRDSHKAARRADHAFAFQHMQRLCDARPL